MEYLLLKFNSQFKVNGMKFETIQVHQDYIRKHGRVNWAQAYSGTGRVPNIDETLIHSILQRRTPFIFLASEKINKKRHLYIAQIESIFNHQHITELDNLSLETYEKLVPEIYNHKRETSLNQSRGFFIITDIFEIDFDLTMSLLRDKGGNPVNLDNQANVRKLIPTDINIIESLLNVTPLEMDLREESPEDISSQFPGNPDTPDSIIPQKTKEQVGRTTIDRDHRLVADALAKANYECEYCRTSQHIFTTRSHKPYTEGHHLIPISKYNEYNSEISPDTLPNIVSLCVYCHRTIHRGSTEIIDDMLKYLSSNRYNRLKNVGLIRDDESLDAFIDRLKSYYY